MGVAAGAQQPGVSPSDAVQPTPAEATPKTASPYEDATNRLPVSIDRIRKGLAGSAPGLTLRFTKTPDFKSSILEQQKLNEIIASLDFKAGPVPAGGLYYYEQQRVFFNPIDHPLMQPYAAFNGGELLTVAIENLAASYLGGKILDTVTSARRAHAEAAAREEVARAIDDYCAAQPYRGSGILICENPSFAIVHR
jgi:hypothetical protein